MHCGKCIGESTGLKASGVTFTLGSLAKLEEVWHENHATFAQADAVRHLWQTVEALHLLQVGA